MNYFISNKSIFALNYVSKKIEMINKGTMIKPRHHDGNKCIILVDNTLYELTVDVFKEFFVAL